jgi:O-antigen biosynthesis protein
MKSSSRTFIERALVQMGRGLRQSRNLLRKEGIDGFTRKARATVAESMQPANSILPVRWEDLLLADLSRPFQPEVREPKSGEEIIVNWVTTPPSPGSGGHTTLFRVVNYLEANGYKNRIYFYDVYGGDHRYYEGIVRRYYKFYGPVGRVENGMENAHAVVATGWPTAYAVFNSRCAGKRFYFIQDYEPYFYAPGTSSFLAKSTYQMGFHGITIGRCFTKQLADCGMQVDSFEYGCDLSQYRRKENSKRSGVVFYARPETPRRGTELGLVALQLLHQRLPDVPIHLYGKRMGKLPFDYVDHGYLKPDQLNDLYNECRVGLSLSFTNVSLVAYEMLAAGCIPVVNDTPEVRIDVNNSFVRYVEPYPYSLAAELERTIISADFDTVSRNGAASLQSKSWDVAGEKAAEIFRRALSAPTKHSYLANASIALVQTSQD